jgi:Mrp family chromosome partitioning ATPase
MPPATPWTGRRRTASAQWINARARNTLRRPVRIGVIGLVAFIASLLTLVALPRQAQRAAAIVAPAPNEWRDTTRLLASVDRERASLDSAESSLASIRALLSRPVAAPAVESLPPEILARRDSIAALVTTLTRLIARVEQSPLAASYRALADAPALRDEPSVRALVDSLGDVERERDAFGAVGGIDPNYVALTARATEIGHAIHDIAGVKRDALQRQAAALTPPPPAPVARPVIDTTPRVARRDSIRALLETRTRMLDDARRVNAAVEKRAERARELANVSAPPLALLGASLVIGIAIGFATGLIGEMRRPRVADVGEAERATGLRVLAHVRPYEPPPERARRRADRELPPLLEPGADGYRLLYLQLSGMMPGSWIITVAGRESTLAAVVAANVTALAALDARASLLVDADPAGCAAGVMRIAPSPGLGDIARGELAWSEAPVTQIVGRDRATDVVPAGRRAEAAEIAASLAREVPRLARRYDTVVVTSGMEALHDAPVLAVPRIVVVVHTGVTVLTEMARDVAALRANGAQLLGLVLWDREEPHVPTREELDALASAANRGVPAEMLIGSRVG